MLTGYEHYGDPNDESKPWAVPFDQYHEKFSTLTAESLENNDIVVMDKNNNETLV